MGTPPTTAGLPPLVTVHEASGAICAAIDGTPLDLSLHGHGNAASQRKVGPTPAVLSVVAGPPYPGSALVTITASGQVKSRLRLGATNAMAFQQALTAALSRAQPVAVQVTTADGVPATLFIRSTATQPRNIIVVVVERPGAARPPAPPAAISIRSNQVRDALIRPLAEVIRPLMQATRETSVEVTGVQHRRPPKGSCEQSRPHDATLRLSAGATFPYSCLVNLAPRRQHGMSLRMDRAAIRRLDDALTAAIADDQPSLDFHHEIDVKDFRGRSGTISVNRISRAHPVLVTLIGDLSGDCPSDIAAIELDCSDVRQVLLPGIRTRPDPHMHETGTV